MSADVATEPRKAPEPPANPYGGVGRQAWIILWSAFIVFVMLLVGVPLGVRWYLYHAVRPLVVQTEAVRGTALVIDASNSEPVGVTEMRQVKQGTLVRIDDLSRATLSVLAGADNADALATVQLRSNSELLVKRAVTPRFGLSSDPARLDLKLNLGRARVTGAESGSRPSAITVVTPHATIRLRDGDAAIAVNNAQTEVSARHGEVDVEAEGQSIALAEGERSVIGLHQPPSPPQGGAFNLVRNGDFTEPLEGTWEVEATVDAKDTSNVEYGAVSVTQVSGRNAAFFSREAEGNDAYLHSETAIVQEIDADVLDYDSMVLTMDVRLLNQSLPGGGQQSSEFPLMVRIDFVDVNGNDQFWTWGFYMIDPIQNWPIRGGEKIPGFIFYDYESPDFLSSPTFPRPQKVKSIRIYASGHNYQSQVTGINLTAR